LVTSNEKKNISNFQYSEEKMIDIIFVKLQSFDNVLIKKKQNCIIVKSKILNFNKIITELFNINRIITISRPFYERKYLKKELLLFSNLIISINKKDDCFTFVSKNNHLSSKIIFYIVSFISFLIYSYFHLELNTTNSVNSNGILFIFVPLLIVFLIICRKIYTRNHYSPFIKPEIVVHKVIENIYNLEK